VLAVKVEEDNVQALLIRLREKLADKKLSLSIGLLSIDPQHEESIEAMYAEKQSKPNRRQA
jgi:hypothetical protein